MHWRTKSIISSAFDFVFFCDVLQKRNECMRFLALLAGIECCWHTNTVELPCVLLLSCFQFVFIYPFHFASIRPSIHLNACTVHTVFLYVHNYTHICVCCFGTHGARSMEQECEFLFVGVREHNICYWCFYTQRFKNVHTLSLSLSLAVYFSLSLFSTLPKPTTIIIVSSSSSIIITTTAYHHCYYCYSVWSLVVLLLLLLLCICCGDGDDNDGSGRENSFISLNLVSVCVCVCLWAMWMGLIQLWCGLHSVQSHQKNTPSILFLGFFSGQTKTYNDKTCIKLHFLNFEIGYLVCDRSWFLSSSPKKMKRDILKTLEFEIISFRFPFRRFGSVHVHLPPFLLCAK